MKGWHLRLVAIGLVVTSCSKPPIEVRTFHLPGGGSVVMQIEGRNATSPPRDGMSIDFATFMISGSTEGVVQTFAFSANRKNPPRVITVEDVSSDVPTLIVRDTAPKLTLGGKWVADVPLKDPAATAALLALPGDTKAFFLFTITLADGQTFRMHTLSVWDSYTKSDILRALRGQNN